MIKMVFTVRRKAGLSRAEFQRYWYDEHGPLVRSKAGDLRIRRYVQTHALDTPVNAVLARGRGSEPDAYDGVAELWWDSLEDFRAAGATPEGRAAAAALLADERTFIDLPNSPLWLGEEREVVG